MRARNKLEKLKFCFPNIDRYIAEFEDLMARANYDLGSQEAINIFLKGFNQNHAILD